MSRCERCDRETCDREAAVRDYCAFYSLVSRHLEDEPRRYDGKQALAWWAGLAERQLEEVERCERNAVDWRARYLALRDAVREEREAEATYRTASRFIGGEEADARHDEHQRARAAVDRILDEGGSK